MKFLHCTQVCFLLVWFLHPGCAKRHNPSSRVFQKETQGLNVRTTKTVARKQIASYLRFPFVLEPQDEGFHAQHPGNTDPGNKDDESLH